MVGFKSADPFLIAAYSVMAAIAAALPTLFLYLLWTDSSGRSRENQSALTAQIESKQEVKDLKAEYENTGRRSSFEGIGRAVSLNTGLFTYISYSIVAERVPNQTEKPVPDYIFRDSVREYVRWEVYLTFVGFAAFIFVLCFTYAQLQNRDTVSGKEQKKLEYKNAILALAKDGSDPSGVFSRQMEASLIRADGMQIRSTLLLAGGVIMAFLGLAIFVAILPEIQPFAVQEFIKMDRGFAELWLVAQYLRPSFILIVVETIAWFLLRQYSRSLDDYKSFGEDFIEHGNRLAAYKMLSPREEELIAVMGLNLLEQQRQTPTADATTSAETITLFDKAAALVARATEFVKSIGGKKAPGA